MQIECAQKGHQILGTAGINALTLGYGIEMIEHGEGQRAGLMYGADDIATLYGQLLQQRY